MNNLHTYTDEALWNKFLEGDEKAYSLIYKRYAPKVYAFGMRFTTDSELVKDCMHDVFVKIYQNRKNLSTAENIKLYLFMAMKSRLFNVFRKDVGDLYYNDTIEPIFSPNYTIEQEIIFREEQQYKRDKMKQMLNSLSPRQKEAIYYRYIENLSFEEIEEIMKINYQSIHNLIQRSIKKLRADFANSFTHLYGWLFLLLFLS